MKNLIFSKKSIQPLLMVLLVFLLGSCVNRSEQSQTTPKETILQKVKRTKVIHAGYIKYPPFMEVDPKSGELGGYFIEMMDHIVELMGRDIKIEYEETTWGTMVAGIQSGKFDFVVSGIFSTIPRLSEVTFTRPVLFNISKRTTRSPFYTCR